MIGLENIPNRKFGSEEIFGLIGPTKKWWIEFMQLSFPEAPEHRLGNGLELAQACSQNGGSTPQQACAASLLMITGVWGLLSQTFKYFNEEKMRMEMEISELKTRLTRLEFKKEEKP